MAKDEKKVEEDKKADSAAVLVAKDSLQISAPSTDYKKVLQNLVTTSVMEIAANPIIVKRLMSSGSYQHLREDDKLAAASFGKAVERLTAEHVADDPQLNKVVSHTGRSRGPNGKFISSPDFTVTIGETIQIFDVTTQAEVSKHEKRYGNNQVEYLVYTRPANLRYA